MKYLQFATEARKNPELNPKTSINDIIIDAVNNTTDTVAGVKNKFASFTKLDKLGVNPKSQYDTPLGIYCYPAEYVVKIAGSEKKMTSLPFAGESPYVNIFSVSGNIINVATISEQEVEQYYDDLVKMWVETSGEDRDTSILDVEGYIKQAKLRAKFPDYAGGRLWYVLWSAANELFGPKWKIRPMVAWNVICRNLGIDGVVDYAETGGKGIIHTSEPSQAVLFTINIIQDVKRYDNKYSPDLGNRLNKEIAGIERHAEISLVANEIKGMSTEEIVKYFEEIDDYRHIRVIKDPAAREEIITKMPHLIEFLPNPTPKEQYIVLSKRFNYIQNIRKPDEDVVLRVLDEQPDAKVDYVIAAKMPYAGERLQMLLVAKQPYQIVAFTKPAAKAVILALRNIPDPPPAVIKAAKKAGVDYKKYINPEQTELVKKLRRDIRLAEYELSKAQHMLFTAKSDREKALNHMKNNNVSKKDIDDVDTYFMKNIKELTDKALAIEDNVESLYQQLKQELETFK